MKSFQEALKSTVIIESKQAKKVRKQLRRKKQRVWPRDFVNQPSSLEHILDVKLSQWHDDDWDEGKGDHL
jgi:hypothetical protein